MMRRFVSLLALSVAGLSYACGDSGSAAPSPCACAVAGAGGTGGAGAAGASAGGTGGGAGSSGGGTDAGGMDGTHGPFTPPKYAPGAKPAAVTFPATFVFAAASAGEQAEKGLAANDWTVWASLPGKIANSDLPDSGPDFFAHVDGDIQAMKDAKLGGYRFSIELARLYPTRAAFDADTPDADGVAKYEGLLAKLAAAGVAPMVTLNHFAFPTWMSDVTKPSEKQGWERDDAVAVFADFAKRVATRWGKYVDLWITINEPNVQSSVGYLAGIWPPGVSDAERMVEVQRQQVRAHAKAYDAIHAADTIDADGDGKAAMVSMALHQRVYLAKDPENPDDVAAADHATYFWNYWYLNALTKGDLDWDFDEKLDGVNDRKAAPDLAGRLDFVGLNYYGVSTVSAKSIHIAYMGQQPSQSNLPTSAPKTAMGWDIYPQGFGQVIDQITPFKLPIYVTENGVAQETSEPTRVRFVAEHLFEVGWAIARGADIRGYAYWALTDNFEWQSGYCPKFGLYTVDYSTPLRTRTPAAGRDELAKIAGDRKLVQTDIDALAPYPQKPAKPCKAF